MAANNSTAARGNERVVMIQAFIILFLSINLLLIMTFFTKEFFFTSMRYILFALTLMSDCLVLILADVLLLVNYFNVTMQLWLCIVVYIVVSVYTFVTPVTLTVMSLERYAAICLPLRHGELCSTRSAWHGVLVIHSFSSVPCIFVLSAFFAWAPPGSYTQRTVCSMEVFIPQTWQGHLRSAISQFYFLIMCVIIVFCYVKITTVAKAASGEDKKSTWRGLKTVMLHAFQLLLCLIQLWCPIIEAAVFQINFILFINVRYFNYITFILAPRCLSPLVYGLRDEMFFDALKRFAFSCLVKKQ